MCKGWNTSQQFCKGLAHLLVWVSTPVHGCEIHRHVVRKLRVTLAAHPKE
jgi:hypothetical protein